MRQAWSMVLVVALFGMTGSLGAQDKTKTDTTGQKGPHLGVFAAPIPPALYNQLPPGVLANGDGILVLNVEKDSPAAKAGLKANDILVTFDNQKLQSALQLVKLVRNDKIGQLVSITYLRGGKTMSAKATLAVDPHPEWQNQPRTMRFYPDGDMRRMFEDFDSKADPKFWDTFDALKLTRIDSKQWSAQIDYRTKDGKKETRNYKGTREEIRKSIEAEKDLPANERTHLLRALNMHEPSFQFHFPLMEPYRGDRP